MAAMKSLKDFVAMRVSNPVRKKRLEDLGWIGYNTPAFKTSLKQHIKYSSLDAMGDHYQKEMKSVYHSLHVILSPRAETYLNNAVDDYTKLFIRPTCKGYEKILDTNGVQVFVDTENVPMGFSETPIMQTVVKHGVMNMLDYIKDILPNKKPRIIITDLSKHGHSKDLVKRVPSAMGMEMSKTIFLDYRHLNKPSVFIHEYAHYVADLVNKQTEKLLIDAYKEMIDMYFRMAKKKKVDPSQITDKMRAQISKKLKFPEYGLTNHHELFAVLIENWKKFPNNKLTYKFKSLVKDVLNRVQ